MIDEIRKINTTIKSKKGARYIEYLIINQNKDIPYITLSRIYNPADCSGNVDIDIANSITDAYMFSSIPKIDKKTKDDVQKAINKLAIKIELADSLSQNEGLYYTVYEQMIKEREVLIKYLADSIKKNGKIRHFEKTVTKPKRSVVKCIEKYLNEIKSIYPEIFKFIIKSIQKSYYTITFKN